MGVAVLFVCWNFKFGFIELFAVYFSAHGGRKVPKERHQRAGRPLDTCFTYMGLFDRGYTRRGIRKALRQSQRRRFSHAPPNSTPSRCAAIVAVAASLPRRARTAIRQTPYLPAEKKGEFRADGAPPSVRGFGSWRPPRAIRLFRPIVGERVAQIRWRVSQGRHRG